MLTLRRFKTLADIYGAELQCWPDAVRDEAKALLNVSPQARLLLAEAQMVDEEIKAASTREDAVLWPPGEQSAALARLRSGVAARLASSSAGQTAGRRAGWALSGGTHRAIWLNLRWLGMATGGGFAVAAGLLIGSMYASQPPQGNLLSLLQPAPIQILAD